MRIRADKICIHTMNMTDDDNVEIESYSMLWEILVIVIIILVCIFYSMISWSLRNFRRDEEDNDTMTHSSYSESSS